MPGLRDFLRDLWYGSANVHQERCQLLECNLEGERALAREATEKLRRQTGDLTKLRERFEKAQVWSQHAHSGIRKLKEQIAHDQQFIENLKQRNAFLEATVAEAKSFARGLFGGRGEPKSAAEAVIHKDLEIVKEILTRREEDWLETPEAAYLKESNK